MQIENTDKDAKWYIADLVLECQIEREPRNIVHVNIVLIRANSSGEAFEKAEQRGKQYEDSYLNPNNQQVTWIFRGLRDLNIVDDKLEDGTELMFEEEVDISEDDVNEMLTSRSQLNIFRPNEPRDLAKPDYACQEILEEVDSMIRRYQSDLN